MHERTGKIINAGSGREISGPILSSLLRFLAGKWYMPTVFVGICLFVAIVYMYWLDGQDWRNR